MPENWSNINVTPGSSSEARLPEPLRRDAPKLRPGDLAQSLVDTAVTASAPWDAMLRSEPALVAAQIMSFRLDDEVMRFDFAQEDGPVAAAKCVQALATELDDWLKRIRRQMGSAFKDTLDALDRQMALSDRVGSLAKASVPELLGVVHQKGFVPATSADPLTRASAVRAGLSAAHRQLMHAIGSLQPIAKAAFRDRIHSGDVEPAVGLVLAELAMAGDVDARLNLFGQRHTNFYYRDIIGQDRRGALPERALLHLPSGAQPQFLPKGSGVLAKLADGSKVRFETENDVAVSPAKVKSTAALTYVTDMQDSLASSLGAITGISATIEPSEVQPLSRRVFTAPATKSVDMGLDIASDMLTLSEGRRQITIALEMSRATDLPTASTLKSTTGNDEPDPDIELELRSDPALIDALGFSSRKAAIQNLIGKVHSKANERGCGPSMDLIYEVIAGSILDVEPLRLLLGRIVTLAMLEKHSWPDGDYRKTLEQCILARQDDLTGQTGREKQRTEDVGDIIEAFTTVNGEYVYTPDDIFQKLLGDAFDVTLSTADGPIRASTTQFALLDDDTTATAGFRILLTLDEDLPPLAPPADGEHAAPVLSLRWSQAARSCPVSLFERYTLDSVGISVAADGVRKVAAFSDDGPLAATQSFLPFGARPSEGATFTITAPEMAAKPVDQVRLDLEWGDLPDVPGGLETHYEHYPRHTKVPQPKITAHYLAADGWKPVIETPRPMLNTRSYDGKLSRDWALRATIPGITMPVAARASAKLPKSRDTIEGGALRLTLQDTGDFGQGIYPLALVNAMRPRLVPIRPRKVPPAPYLPKIASLRLGYTASSSIELSAPDSARSGDRVIQVTPFGKRRVFPGRVQRDFGLFPRRLGLATLYVQLAGPGSKRGLGLLFDIADSGHQRVAPAPVSLQWHYLTGDGWTALPETAISSDTTDALTRSGVVMLDLPDDAETPEGVMPSGGVWVAVSTSSPNFETRPVLSHVRTNGVWAARTTDDDLHAEGSREWRFETAKPGLAPPIETGRRAPPRPAESRPHYLARVSERLRHRKRAVAPYDIERLVLEAFPDVWLAKCLPHLTRQTPTPQPGHVTVVITRHPPDLLTETTQSPQPRLFDAGTLQKVQNFLKRHGSEGVFYHVVNPAFDRIQVRTAVRFAPFRDDGALAHQLRLHLTNALSVWTATDDLGQFGWSLQVPMLRAQIAALDYVVDVTDFSVLHFMVDDNQTYRLADTARPDDEGGVIRPSRPWALALSANDHAISTIETKQTITPTPSGIGRLRVGDMLIIGQEARQ